MGRVVDVFCVPQICRGIAPESYRTARLRHKGYLPLGKMWPASGKTSVSLILVMAYEGKRVAHVMSMRWHIKSVSV